MLKRIAVGLVLVLLTAGAAEAQTTANDDATVSVTVYSGLSLTAYDATVDFGVTNPSTAPAPVDPQTGGADAAGFVAAGQSGAPINVQYPATVDLDNGFGSTVTYTPDLAGADALASRATAPAVANNSTVNLNASTGDYFFWLGGGVTAPAAAGTYTGVFTLTVSY